MPVAGIHGIIYDNKAGLYAMGAGLLSGIMMLMGASQATDFGIRVPPGEPGGIRSPAYAAPLQAAEIVLPRFSLRSAAAIGSQWGRVTSLRRSPERNRAVGGVRNSFHLSGRAIDIARHTGVSHRQIEGAYRQAGYGLIESLDEGDHSHFAFGVLPTQQPPKVAGAPARTNWGIVFAPAYRKQSYSPR